MYVYIVWCLKRRTDARMCRTLCSLYDNIETRERGREMDKLCTFRLGVLQDALLSYYNVTSEIADAETDID